MKLGTIGATRGVPRAQGVDIGGTARALAPIAGAFEQASGIAFDIDRQEKEEAQKQYDIGQQLASDFRTKKLNKQVNDEVYDLTVEHNGFMQEYGGREAFDSRELAGYNLDIPMTETIVGRDGVVREVPRDRIPSYEVFPEMYRQFANKSIQNSQHRLGPVATNKMMSESSDAYTNLKVQANEAQSTYILAEHQEKFNRALRDENYTLAVDLAVHAPKSDVERRADIEFVKWNREFNSVTDAVVSGNVAQIDQQLSYQLGENVGRPLGQQEAFRGFIAANEADSRGYDSLVNERRAYLPDPDWEPSKHTLAENSAMSIEWRSNQRAAKKDNPHAFEGDLPSSAMGMYQIVGKTLDLAITELKLDPNAMFDQEMQDHIAFEYLLKKKRPSIGSFIGAANPTQEQTDKAVEALMNEWQAFEHQGYDKTLSVLNSMREDARAENDVAPEQDEKAAWWNGGSGFKDYQGNFDKTENARAIARLRAAKKQALAVNSAGAKANNQLITTDAATIQGQLYAAENIEGKGAEITGLKLKSLAEQDPVKYAGKYRDFTEAFEATALSPDMPFSSDRANQEVINKFKSENHPLSAKNERLVNVMEKRRAAADKSVRTDMISHLGKLGIGKFEPLNFSDSAELGKQFRNREEQLKIGKEMFAVDGGIFTDGDIKALVNTLETASPKEKLLIAERIHSAAPELSKKVFNQLSSKTGNKFAIHGRLMVEDRQEVSSLALDGQDWIASPVNKGAKFGGNKEEVKMVFKEYAGDMLERRPNEAEGRKQMALDIYVGISKREGLDPSEYDEDRWERAYKMLNGNVAEMGDFQIEVPNKGMVEGQYDSYLRDYMGGEIVRLGGIFGIADDKVGEFVEKVRNGDGYKFVSIDINQTLIKKADGSFLMKEDKSGPFVMPIYNQDATATVKQRPISAVPPEAARVHPAYTQTAAGKERPSRQITAFGQYGALDEGIE